MSFTRAMSRLLPGLGRIMFILGLVALGLLGAATILIVVLTTGGSDALSVVQAVRLFWTPLLVTAGLTLVGRVLSTQRPERIAAVRPRTWLLGGAVLAVALGVWLSLRPPSWDGGPWHAQKSGTQDPLWRITGTPDGSRLWAVGWQTVLQSRDLGTTWTTVRSDGEDRYREVVVSPDGQGVLITGWRDAGWGEDGRQKRVDIGLRSTDGGTTWAALDEDAAAHARSIRRSADGRCQWIRTGEHSWRISRDAGATWTTLEVDVGGTAEGEGKVYVGALYLDGHDETLFLRVDGETVRRSTDGGATWSSWVHAWSPWKSGQNHMLWGFFGTSEVDDVWVIGHMEILHSDNRGRSFDVQDRQRWPGTMHGSADASVLWAVGDRGTILFGTRASDDWDLHDSPTDVNLHDVFVTADGNHAWAVGNGGTILHVQR